MVSQDVVGEHGSAITQPDPEVVARPIRRRLTGRSRGPKEKNREVLQGEIKQLRRKLEQTQKRLAKTELVAHLLVDLGVAKTHSRPHVSNDNPFSESAFKTLKYRPDFPERFGAIEHSRAHCRDFFGWYNTEHRHSGIAMLTPHQVHYGCFQETLNQRSNTLINAP